MVRSCAWLNCGVQGIAVESDGVGGGLFFFTGPYDGLAIVMNLHGEPLGLGFVVAKDPAQDSHHKGDEAHGVVPKDDVPGGVDALESVGAA